MSETSTELAIRPATPVARRTISRDTTDSWTEVVAEVCKLAGYIADTDFVPRAMQGNAPAVAAAILNGRELGLPPMRALAETHMIEGRSSMSARVVRAMAYDAGHELEFVESTESLCRVRGRRFGQERWTEVTWTMDQARRITTKRGALTTKDNWKNYPRRMLQARATSELCDLLFPDVLNGMGIAEVVEDEVDEDGVVQVEAPKTTPVSRAKPRARQIPSGLPAAPAAAKPDTEPPALEVDIEPPAAPAPNPPAGPARVETPGPAAEEPTREQLEAENRLIDQTLEEGLIPEELRLAAERAPEREQPATVHQIRTEDQPKVSPGQLRLLGANWTRLGVTNDLDRRAFTAMMIGRELAGGTTKDVTQPEAKRLIDVLGRLETPDALDDLIAQLQQEGGED